MRFLLLVEAPADAPSKRLEERAAFHRELTRAGVLLDAALLAPDGWRVEFRGARRAWVDGPRVAPARPIAGYTLVQVASSEEALEWCRRFPSPARTGAIECRRVVELGAGLAGRISE